MVDKDRSAQSFEGQRQVRPVAYRIMGSAAKTDEAVQDVWIRLSRSDIDCTTT
jgi:RNA polymerase sigma-70 factor (ECF subfamily)